MEPLSPAGLAGRPLLRAELSALPPPRVPPAPVCRFRPFGRAGEGRGKLFGNEKRQGGRGVEDWAQAEGRVSPVLEVAEAKRRIPPGEGGGGGGGHRTASPAAAYIPVHRHVWPVRGNAPAFAFAISAVWWFKKTAVRTWPRGKTRPSRPSRGFNPFRLL